MNTEKFLKFLIAFGLESYAEYESLDVKERNLVVREYFRDLTSK